MWHDPLTYILGATGGLKLVGSLWKIGSAAAATEFAGGAEAASAGNVIKDLLQKSLSSGDWEVSNTIDTAAGQVQIAGQASANGTTLHISDAMIYPVGQGVKSVSLGPNGVMSLICDVGKIAKQLGFETLHITGDRVTGANPGHVFDKVFDLAKRFFE